jgi:hypothetical protein
MQNQIGKIAPINRGAPLPMGLPMGQQSLMMAPPGLSGPARGMMGPSPIMSGVPNA